MDSFLTVPLKKKKVKESEIGYLWPVQIVGTGSLRCGDSGGPWVTVAFCSVFKKEGFC